MIHGPYYSRNVCRVNYELPFGYSFHNNTRNKMSVLWFRISLIRKTTLSDSQSKTIVLYHQILFVNNKGYKNTQPTLRRPDPIVPIPTPTYQFLPEMVLLFCRPGTR